MANYGTIFTYDLAEPVASSAYGATSPAMIWGVVYAQNPPIDQNAPLANYSLTGTLAQDAGNPPPTRGQIWPRGNIVK